MNYVLEVNNLQKWYGKKCVVNNLSLQVEKGTVLGLLGANGAGKSTSIECILGTKKADGGSAVILGKDPQKSRRELFQQIGVQFQEANYQNEIRVDELCEETASFYPKPADYYELLKKFGLEGKEKQAVKSLSGGERQKLFIVLALIPQPEVVFLDELTTGLDARARRDVWKKLENLKKEGLTIILTSHFMDEVEVLCDKICILKKGETVFYGTVNDAVEKSPCSRFEDAYLWYTEEEEEDENIL